MKLINKRLKVILVLSYIINPHLADKILSQDINLEKKISIVAKDKPLKEVLKEIEQKGKLTFSYSNQQINADKKVSLVARKKLISTIFAELFAQTNIDYQVIEKQVVLKPKRLNLNPSPNNLQENKKYTLNGYLKDAETQEALIGGIITIKNKSIGAVTNSYGFFSITMPVGFYEFNFQYLGYKDSTISIYLDKDMRIAPKLLLDEKSLAVIVISADERNDVHEINPTRKINFSPLTLNNKVGISGETDLIQLFQSVPGMQSQSDGSVFFFTRGGNKDQNLILVDDAPIYNPSHLFGFFSTISPDAIQDISIYKNYFPVQYGGRLSSIVDLRTKDGSMNNFGFQGNVNPLTSSISIEGPIIKEKASYFLSIRNSNVNWINNMIQNYQKFEFTDINAKINAKMNQKNRIYFSFYRGTDHIQYFETGYSTFAIKWQNFASTLRWNHLFSEKLFSNTMVYGSVYDYYLYTSVEDDQYWNSMVGNISFKSDFSWYANTKNTFRFGGAINSHYFNPGNLNDKFYSTKVSASDALEAVLYFGNDLRLNENLSINYGIRLINWNNVGPTASYTFDEAYNPIDTNIVESGIFHSTVHYEPRADLMYSINNTSTIKLSYNHQIQNLHLLSNSISPLTTLDIWMPSSPNIKPQIMNQFVLAYYKKFTEFDFLVEGYYKNMLNQIEYAEHANMLLNTMLEGQLRFGESNSKGIEISLKKQKGNLTGSICYSFSKTINQIKDINANQPYSPYYDKPHQINISLSLKASERWRINANWIYSSGTRFSAPTGFYYVNGYLVPHYTEKNNQKLPEYHRMDFSAAFRLNKNDKANYTHYLGLTIINLYARRNPISVNFNKIESEDGKYVIPSNYIVENQIFPTSIYLLGITPSISYKFSFRKK